jgi:choice-of-anchor B domain-containing protein
MRHHVTLLLSCISLFNSVRAQVQLDTIRHHREPSWAGGLSALWGYTAPNGREYALVGIVGYGGYPGGTAIVDITENATPRQVAFVPAAMSYNREQKSYQHYAYSVSDNGSSEGVQIIDLSGLPNSVRHVRNFNYISGNKNILRSHTITIDSGFMYLNGCVNWSPGGTLIFDLRSNPENPQFVGEYQTGYWHHDSFVSRDTIYVSAMFGGAFIASIANKTSIQTARRITYSGSGTHNLWLTTDRRYALTTDEFSRAEDNVKVWDLAVSPPTRVASFTINPTVTVHNVVVRGNYAFTSWYGGYGLQVWDISNPPSPVYVGGYRTSSGALAWQVYPFFPSGKIILSDGSTGLWIFRLRNSSVPVTLASFRGMYLGRNRVRLQWRTVSEINCYGFEMQKSAGGAGAFTTIPGSFIAGSGTTNVPRDYEFIDTTASVGSLRYRLKQIDLDGTVNLLDPITVVAATSVAENSAASFLILKSYPNPFNSSAKIEFHLKSGGATTLEIFDVYGRAVRTLVQENLEAGFHSREFDASGLASGIYICRLNSGLHSTVRRLSLLR